jgi:epsin
MEMLDKRLNDKGKNWRHVFKVKPYTWWPWLNPSLINSKSLTLLDYCLHAGSENVVIYFRDNLYVIKTLREFQFVDEYGKDQGANVRQKAKDIVNLLQDEARLRHERKSRAHMRDRMVTGRNNYDEDGEADNENTRRRSRSVPPARRRGGDDDQLRRAIEESKRTAEEESARLGRMTAEERDLAQAIKLSQEEEDKRSKAVEDSNANSLFDDSNQLYVFHFLMLDDLLLYEFVRSPQTQQGFGLIDPSAYTTGLQPQFTAMQPQFTSFNPYQQQAQQEAMQVRDFSSAYYHWSLTICFCLL